MPTECMTRIRVALFPDHCAAEPARQRLAEVGIPARIHHEPGVARLWFVSTRNGGARLEVPAFYEEAAVKVLIEGDAATTLLGSAVRCPECGSLRVDYPQFTQKSLLTNLMLGVAAELRLLERDYYCEDCHCMWAKPEDKPRRARLHMAPNYFIEDGE